MRELLVSISGNTAETQQTTFTGTCTPAQGTGTTEANLIKQNYARTLLISCKYYLGKNNSDEAMKDFQKILNLSDALEESELICIKLDVANNLIKQAKLQDAKEIIPNLQDILKADQKCCNSDILNKYMQTQYSLAHSLYAIKKDKEAEEILRNLLHLKSKNNHQPNHSAFSGNQDIEHLHARCLERSIDKRKRELAAEIYLPCPEGSIKSVSLIRRNAAEKLEESKNIKHVGEHEDPIRDPREFSQMFSDAAEKASKLENRNQPDMARSIREKLYSQVNKIYSGPRNQPFRLRLMFKLGLHTYLNTIGTEMLNDAERSFRDLRRQKSGSEHTFCGNRIIEYELARCLKESDNDQKLKEATNIFSQLAFDTNSGSTRERQKSGLGLLFCLSARKKFDQCEKTMSRLLELSDDCYLRKFCKCSKTTGMRQNSA